MTYTNTFIQVSPDSPATSSVIPAQRGNQKPQHLIQYELLTADPYTLTHYDLVFAVHVRYKGISEHELQERGQELRSAFLSKGHPCLRASALTKRYGWGAHYNEEGKIALYAMESDDYQAFVGNQDQTTKILAAFRSKRK